MKIAIVGNGPLTRGLAPFNSDWEVWGLAYREFQYREFYGKPRAYTEIWECHEYQPIRKEYADFIGTNRVLRPDLNKCRKIAGEEGFKSSLAYMIVEAISRNPEEIALYGFDAIVSPEEYQDQIPNIKYFIGLAAGKGIKVSAPPQSNLFVTGEDYGTERLYTVTPTTATGGVSSPA